MKNYTLQQLKRNIDNGTNLESIAKELKLRQYVPIHELKQYIEDLVEKTLIKNGRIYTYNSIDKFVTLINGFIYLYVINLTKTENDKYEDYDLMIESGLLDYITTTLLPEQYQEFCAFFDMSLEEKIRLNNDFETVITKIVDDFSTSGISILKQADDFIEVLKGVITSLDEDTLKSLLSVFVGSLK